MHIYNMIMHLATPVGPLPSSIFTYMYTQQMGGGILSQQDAYASAHIMEVEVILCPLADEQDCVNTLYVASL